MTTMPNRVTDSHRHSSQVLLAAYDGPRTRGRAERIRVGHAALRSAWRDCPDHIDEAVESARAILRVPRRDRTRANGQGRAMSKRAIDVPDELWFPALAAAHARGVTLASVVRDALEDLVEAGA